MGPTVFFGTQQSLPLESNTDPITIRLKPSFKEQIYREAEALGKKPATYLRELLELGREYLPIKHASVNDLIQAYHTVENMKKTL